VTEVSFGVKRAETCVLVGPSGCGKTTTLRMINRVIESTSGTIHVRGQEIKTYDAVALRRSIGYVIQQVGLFPHMTIEDNVGIVLRLLGAPRRRRRERAAELLNLVGLDPVQFLARYPSQLSGGQQQRVGVARALAADPDIILMDEPFGAVDPIVRGQLQKELRRIQASVHKTIVFVTHDLAEALYLGDRLVLMKDGRVLQQGTPRELLFAPVHPFVTEFFADAHDFGQLSLVTVAEIMMPAPGSWSQHPCARILASASLIEAMRALGTQGAADGGVDPVLIQVLEPGGAIAGAVTYQALITAIGKILSPQGVARELSAVQQ
jgi:osmoprotectant transport system ATP-binding protein